MKINEIKSDTVYVIVKKGNKQITFEEKVEDAGLTIKDIPYISTQLIKTEDGKTVDISGADKVYIQAVDNNVVFRFDVKNDTEDGKEIFTCNIDGMKIEQRQAYRLPLGQRCEVTVNQKTQNAIIKDVSITGFCTIGLSLQLKVGDEVKIRFDDKLPGKISIDSPVDITLVMTGVVVRSRDAGSVKEYGLRIITCDPQRLVKYISIKQRQQIRGKE